jgi:hypothetical protein
MSLEAAIIQNTETMERLIAVWNKLAETTAARPVADKVATKKDVTAASGQPTATEKAQADAPESTTSAPAPAAQSVEAAAPASTAATTITYEQVAKAITDGVKADRAKVVAVLSKFGAKKGTELKTEQYAEFIAELA